MVSCLSLFCSKPSLLKQFIHDLQSGKLHREFHQGPDPTHPPAIEQEVKRDRGLL